MNITTIKNRAEKDGATTVPMTEACTGRCEMIKGAFVFSLWLQTGDVMVVSQRDFSKNLKAAESLKAMGIN